MASHHDWITEMQAKHEAEKPFAPENGQPLKFKVGDKVIYTNDYGVTFERQVTGLVPQTDGSYCLGKRYYLNKDSHWVGVKEESLTPA